MGPFLRGTESHGNVTRTRPRKLAHESRSTSGPPLQRRNTPWYVCAQSGTSARLQEGRPLYRSLPITIGCSIVELSSSHLEATEKPYPFFSQPFRLVCLGALSAWSDPSVDDLNPLPVALVLAATVAISAVSASSPWASSSSMVPC